MRYLALLALCLCVVLCVTTANANRIADSIAYQGQLTDDSNNPVPDGVKDLILSIWTDSTGGTMLFSQTVAVTTSKGLFSTCLGCNNDAFAGLFTGQTLWLETQLAGQPAMTPRTRLRSVPSSVTTSSLHGQSVIPGAGIVSAAVSSVGNLAGSGGGAAAASYARLGADSDGDGHDDFFITDSARTDGVHHVTGGDLDGDGAPDLGVNLEVRPLRVEMKLYDDSDAMQRSSVTQGASTDSANQMLSTDLDGDGVPENEISSAVTPTRAQHAVNTKGTGANNNRVIGATNDTTASLFLAAASANISMRAIHGGGPNKGADLSMTADTDGDGVPEGEIVSSVDPGASRVAIKRKGTGADKDRVAGSSANDSSAVDYLDLDDDGDGISEARATKSVTSHGGGGGGGAVGSYSVRDRWYTDSDDDGVAEGEFESFVTPGTCSVAIKTKGTGADNNRVISQTDDSSSVVLASTDSASITMRVKNRGVIKGAININHASTMRVSLGSDGNGYFATGVGVGVEPTQPFQAAGGAFCDGTTWVNASDANAKENFQPVDGEELLEKISGLEITKWNYKGDNETEHIGPTAQDFQETFGVGSDGKSISTIDPSGIALAAIKELNNKLNTQNQALSQENKQLRKELDELKKLVQQLASGK